jgi:hypothetical protein
MRAPRARITIGRIMVAVAIVAVILAVLPEPVFVIPLPGATTSPLTLPDGTIVRAARATVAVTRFGALLIVAVAGAILLAAAWLARRLLGSARREAPPSLPE